jgi:hypothetical protein
MQWNVRWGYSGIATKTQSMTGKKKMIRSFSRTAIKRLKSEKLRQNKLTTINEEKVRFTVEYHNGNYFSEWVTGEVENALGRRYYLRSRNATPGQRMMAYPHGVAHEGFNRSYIERMVRNRRQEARIAAIELGMTTIITPK